MNIMVEKTYRNFLDMLSEPFIPNQWILDGRMMMMMC